VFYLSRMIIFINKYKGLKGYAINYILFDFDINILIFTNSQCNIINAWFILNHFKF